MRGWRSVSVGSCRVRTRELWTAGRTPATRTTPTPAVGLSGSVAGGRTRSNSWREKLRRAMNLVVDPDVRAIDVEDESSSMTAKKSFVLGAAPPVSSSIPDNIDQVVRWDHVRARE